MITLQLTRTTRNGKAVEGTMVLPFSLLPIGNNDRDVTITTLENAEYIIPAGTYPLDLTWSPKFRKLLPLLGNVPEREGIRIHRGTIPEHSTGCILVDYSGQANIEVLFNRQKKYYENEKMAICITDDFGAECRSGL